MSKRELLPSSSSSSPSSVTESPPLSKTTHNSYKKARVGIPVESELTANMDMLVKKLEKLEEGQKQILRSVDLQFDKLKGLIKALEDRVDQLDRISREKNVILYGLEDSDKETWEKTTVLVKQFFENNLEITNSGIDVADRLGKFKTSHCRPIRIRFSRIFDKRTAMKEKHKLVDPFYMNADLNNADRQANALLRKKKKELVTENPGIKCIVGKGRLTCTNEQGVKVKDFYVNDGKLMEHSRFIMETS